MGIWGTTLHKDTIFLNLFLGQKDSKNTKKSILKKAIASLPNERVLPALSF